MPFITPLPSRHFRSFTPKQHRQCQLAITGIIVLTVGSSYIIVFLVKKIFRFVKVKLKKALTKFSKIKPKPMVQFIPLD